MKPHSKHSGGRGIRGDFHPLLSSNGPALRLTHSLLTLQDRSHTEWRDARVSRNVELLAVWLIGSFESCVSHFWHFQKVFQKYIFLFWIFICLLLSSSHFSVSELCLSWDWARTVWRAVRQKRYLYWELSLLVYRFLGQQSYAKDFASKTQNNNRNAKGERKLKQNFVKLWCAKNCRVLKLKAQLFRCSFDQKWHYSSAFASDGAAITNMKFTRSWNKYLMIFILTWKLKSEKKINRNHWKDARNFFR